MDARTVGSRLRLAAALEWVIAAFLLALSLGIGSLIVRGLRPALLPLPPATGAVTSMPASIPDRALSLTVLSLPDGKELRIGETVAAVATRLGRAAENGRQEVDRGLLGERVTRFYEYRGSHFVLVFEPMERHGEPRLAAIFQPISLSPPARRYRRSP